MTVDDFISAFRAGTLDVAKPFLWSAEEIVSYLNEAVQEACERARLIEDRSTPAVCAIGLVPGQSTYDLHASVFEVKRLALRGHPLTETSVEALDDQQPGWEVRSGAPRCFIFEQASGALPARVRLVPTPMQAESLSLTVYRGALTPLNADRGSDKPGIHERYHPRLLDWMLHRAYLKQDAETFNPTKAAQSLTLFEQAFGERPDANVQRKHRDLAPPIVRSNW
ncbi:DUF6682 family protein [Ottowia testudinis]|uniref:Uncharacterized protein n=1 Tax=Ottowia testudinis TaxID=2816950 RepID=A0A975H268_9BURK|nr:DUF6682 family protein [Ottowia testudinis]QTD44553.1 hypothetical protein J1M35_15850 [Ottowia testudinis]